ncbi:hypothetical protein AMS68_005677 [Peltaster fructicola]|uniref:Uncharacterized protein n=1 Tax=Peltaster fructicola TaxID=286661 RepID=A0A6H0Y0I5_9PEZI|nr:hypothetical protein AMS68_005677 [Peltaster fructicola]
MAIGIKSTASFLKTLFLFGKSDIPAAALPTIAVALVLTGLPGIPAFATGILWLEIHLLAFQIKNQIDGIDEDRVAKPYRPLPAGRLSLQTAKQLYYTFFVLMLLIGALTKTLTCTLTYTAMILAYNEGRLAEFPLSKNILAAGGLICYCWGVTVIFDQGLPLHGYKLLAVTLLGAIFATTGHASDFRDRTADALMGRKTIPLLLPPRLARWSLAVLIALWTAGLMCLWQPPVLASITFTMLAVWTLVGFVASHDEKDDRKSYVLYGFWLLSSNLLPIFARSRGLLV